MKKILSESVRKTYNYLFEFDPKLVILSKISEQHYYIKYQIKHWRIQNEYKVTNDHVFTATLKVFDNTGLRLDIEGDVDELFFELNKLMDDNAKISRFRV